MQTHYSLSTRNLTNVTQTFEAATTGLSYYDVRLVITVVTVDAGASLSGELRAEQGGVPLVRAPINITAPGTYTVGCNYGGATALRYAGSFTISGGRIRLSARVVSFDQTEDIPLTF